ncbi:hypothetical protein AOH398_13230 [Helicobacter pylori]
MAIITTFTHTIGEFGVVMMLGGDILGETRVASIAIFNETEALNYLKAHQYALTLTLISFSFLFVTLFLNKKQIAFLCIKTRFKKRLLGSRGAFDLNIELEIKEAEVVALLGIWSG